MATNIPPHNLGEVVARHPALIDDPGAHQRPARASTVLGPDFPTGGTIFRYDERRNPITGQREGSTRSATCTPTAAGGSSCRRRWRSRRPAAGARRSSRPSIPYQVNKATLLEKIADLVKGGKIDGIADLRDESDRDGMRIVIECKRDAAPRKVLNNLFKHTALKLAFNANIVALVDGQPQTLPLKAILQHHIDWRREVVRRRTEFDLQKARDRAHILEGLKIALDDLDADHRDDPRVGGCGRRPPEPDAPASASRRSRPTRSSRCSCAASRRSSARRSRTSTSRSSSSIAELEDILANPKRVLGIIRDELGDLEKRYGGERLTRIEGSADKELSDEDLIADEDVVITVSGRGYIKRQPLLTYRRQARGGKGIIGARTVEEDAVGHLLVANTHDWALFFTDRGRVFSSKVHAIPDASRQAKGMPIINLEGVQVESGERVLAVITLPDFEKGHNLVMATVKGIIKKTPDRAVRACPIDGHPGHHRGRGRRPRMGRGLVGQ